MTTSFGERAQNKWAKTTELGSSQRRRRHKQVGQTKSPGCSWSPRAGEGERNNILKIN